MTNRLRNFLRATPLFVALTIALLPATRLHAQPSFFNFSYNGPTSLPVGPTCSSMLQGNVPDPVVTSTIGANIVMSMFDPAASGFQYNDLFTTGATAHVFWFVKDDLGHSHTYEYFISFVDVSPPTFNLTGIFDTLEFSSIVAVPPAPNIPVTDNCTMVLSKTFNQTPGPDTCESGTFTRTWTATDANNNTAVFTQTIIIYKDSLPPLITGYPQDGSASCEQLATAYPTWLANQVSIFSATDPSGIFSLTNNAPPSFPPGCKAPLTVRFKAKDNCQFQLNVDVIFNTSDNQGPIVIKPPKDTVAYCSQNDNELTKLREWINKKAYAQAFDTCSAPLSYIMKIGGIVKDSAQVETAFIASFANGCSTKTIGTKTYNKVHGLVTIALSVKDACGNETQMGNVSFGAIDTLPPVIAGVNTIEQCGGGNDQTALQNWINAHGNATVTEDCSDYSWTNFSFITSNGQTGTGNFNIGPYPTVQANNCAWFADVTFRATDDCGNSSTKTLRFSIVDTQAPTFTGLQPNITVYCPNPLPTVPAATLNDNCDAALSVSFTRVYKDSLCDGSYTVLTTWTITDDCGNSASATQNIIVSDTTRPVFTLVPANKTFRCDTFVLPAIPVMGVDIMATDLCAPVVSISTQTNSFQNPDPAVCGHYAYNIVRVFTATDECGNTQTASQTLSIIDNQGPVPGGVLDTTALCSALTPFPAPVPTPLDACSGLTAPPVNTGQTSVPGACTDQYNILVHWLATDVCGNTTTFDQVVHVIDTVPPTLMNVPSNITVECDAIPSPPNTNTFNAADNCDNSVLVTLVETEIRNPDPSTCEHWTDYIIKREWTATDNCGNSRTYTQQIQIEDTTPPAIIPPPAITLPNDPGDCGATISIPAPLSITDICSDQMANANLTDAEFLVQSGPGSPFSTPVASMSFQLNAINTLPFEPVVAGPVTELRITLEKADAEGPTEFFNVYDENNTLLGTANTNSQCGDKITAIPLTPNQLNAWFSDGVANFSLVPNGTGALACNPVCVGGKATVNLIYSYSNTDVPILLTYTLDGGASQNFPPSGQTYLSVGTHTIVYTSTDCAGNSSTASVQITVNDAQPPSLAAPANIVAYTGENNCESTVTLPFPAITENCAMSASLSLASAVLPLQFENDPDVGMVALDISPTLTGIIPNAVGGGILKIRHKGDNAQAGEFFNVYDEGGTFLGTSGKGSMATECSTFVDTIIPVTAAQINNWATMGGVQGSTFFYLETNRDVVNYSEFVGNCAPLLPNGTDGVSQIQVILEYSYAVVNYTVKKPVNQVVASGSLTGSSSTVTLPPANYTVMYNTTDHAGLTGMTSFALTVRDTVKPHAICQLTHIVEVSPAGGLPATILPANINNGSFDNCTPTPNLTYSVSPNVFSCNQAGTSVNVTLTVTDTSGNFATCQTLVGIVNTPPTPFYIPVCENDTLQLFADPPSASPFTYLWNGPNNYFSNLQNPVVTNNAMAVHNGTYCVTVTGATGCTSSSCVVVALAILGNTPVLKSNNAAYCPGQSINLSTDTYNGQFVFYQWLVDSIPALPGGPIELGITTTPVFNIPPPPPGKYVYYLKVFANGCNTTFSNALMVTVHPAPPANAEPEQTMVCEGQSISLQSPTGPLSGLTYQWTGPSSYTSTSQNPLVTNNAVKAIHEGKYILVTRRNGCFSIPDTVMVTVNSKPPKPSIGGNVNACAGQTVNLVCNNLNALQYIWTIPSPTGPKDTITTVNTLQIPNVGTVHEGCYNVIVFANSCFSDASDPICLDVHDIPSVMGNSNSPICQDSLLQLTATFSSEVPLSWCWTGPNNYVNYNQNPGITNGASGTYQVIGKTSYGCADTAWVEVTNVIPPSIVFISNNAPACCNGTMPITLSATITSANLPLTYQWNGLGFGPMGSTLPSPTLGPSSDCTPFNGQYTLVVKDSYGCPSLPATTGINIQNPPVAPLLQVDPLNGPRCAGDSLLLFFNNSTPGAMYTWNLPGGSTTTTNVPFLKLTNIQPGQTGLYSVFATSDNGTCSSGISNALTITINPIPPAPIILSNSPVCQGGVLNLNADVGVLSGLKFMWTGPAGFLDSLQNPVRQPVTLNMEGDYKLKITKDGCTSAEAVAFVDVVPTPSTPLIATPPTGICIDVPDTAFLNINNPVNGMLYTWEDAISGIDLSGPSTSTQLDLSLPNVLALGPGLHSFRVYATTPNPPGCNSLVSNTVSVRFDTIPAGVNAFAGPDRPACVSSAIALSGTPNPLPGMVSGFWKCLPDTVPIDDATSPNAFFHGAANAIYTFQWSLSNGVCMNFSSDTVIITAQSPEIANGGPDIYSCALEGIHLNATQGVNTQGVWTQSIAQTGLGVVIDSTSDPNTAVSGLTGLGQTFSFQWNIGNPGCGISTDEVGVFVYNLNPSAGPIQFVCDDENCADLLASSIASFEIGKWSSADPDLVFSNPNAPNTRVCGLKPGKNVIYWEINNGACGAQSRDTLDIYYEIFPQANDDIVPVGFGGTATFNVLTNDVLPGAFTFNIATPPPLGRLIDTLAAVGGYIYRPQSGFTGTETMTYTITNNNCPGSVSIGTVTFSVGGAPECFIPTIITPNGDGFNDLFTVPTVCTLGEGGAEVDVAIFNQWGDLVFHAKPYNNDWGGTYNNEDLPAGTYFFVVRINENEEPKKGFLLIQR